MRPVKDTAPSVDAGVYGSRRPSTTSHRTGPSLGLEVPRPKRKDDAGNVISEGPRAFPITGPISVTVVFGTTIPTLKPEHYDPI